MNCQFLKQDNQLCNAKAIKNSKYCFSHNPDYVEQKIQAVTKGGLNRRLIESYGEELKIDTASDIKNLISKTINMIWTGKMSTSSPANSIGFLARVFLDAYEKTDIENRISTLEQISAHQSSKG